MYNSAYSTARVATVTFQITGVIVPDDSQSHLLLFFGVDTAVNTTVSSITATDGGSKTLGFTLQVDSGVQGGALQFFCYHSIKPPAGTYTITVTLGAAKTGCMAVVVSKKIYLINPLGNAASSYISGTATDTAAVAGGRGAVLVDCLITTNTGAGPTLSPNANQTQATSVGNTAGSGVKLGVSYRPSTSSYLTLGWSWTGGTFGSFHYVLATIEDSPPRLSELVPLSKASRYSGAPGPGELLPVVFGDFSQLTTIGAVPAICISANRLIWCAADHAVKEITRVYEDHLDVTSSVTVSTSNNYLGLGVIATITFTSEPSGEICWNGQGYEESSVLVTNPIRQIELFLRNYSGLSDADFELYSLSESKYRCDALGYETAFIFSKKNTLQDWLTETLFDVFGYWNVTGDGKIAMYVDTGGGAAQGDLIANVVAARDVMDGDDGVSMSWDYHYLINDLRAEYLYSYSSEEATSIDETNSDDISTNLMGTVTKTVTLKGVRKATHITAWANVLFARQSLRNKKEGAILNFAVHNRRLLIAKPGDFIGLTWAYGPYTQVEGSAASYYTNRVLKIISLEHDLSEGGVTKVSAQDTGAYLITNGGAYFDGSVYFAGTTYYNGSTALTTVLPF